MIMTSHKVSGEFWHGVPNSIAGRKALHPQRARESGAGISEKANGVACPKRN